MKKILLTGATGFIGRHAILPLLKRGYEVHAVARTPDTSIAGVTWHKADLLQIDSIHELLKNIKPSHLLHFAWNVTPGKYLNDMENLQWVQASLALLISFQKCGGERVVFVGSCFEYESQYGFFTEEVTPLKSLSLYGNSKICTYNLFESYLRETKISGAYGRIHFLYGPYENPNRLVPYVILSLLQRRPARCSHGEQIRDFMYVVDVADAFVALLDSDIIGPVNVSSGKPVQLKEVVREIGEKIGLSELIKLGVIPVKDNEPIMMVGNCKKLNSELGWEPKYTLKQGIQDTVEWWKKRI